MAEARSIAQLGAGPISGVGLTFDEEGLHIRTEVLIPPVGELWRRVGRFVRRTYRTYQYALYPFSQPLVFMSILAVFVGVVVSAPRDSWLRSGTIASFVWRVGNWLPWFPGVPLIVRVAVMAAWTTVFGLFLLARVQRFVLKLLLRDKTWLYQSRKPPSWVKAWFLLVKALTRGQPLTYSFQGALPRQPVPPLRRSVEKYLSSAKLLQDDATYAQTQKDAEAFLSGVGPTLQRYLVAKSWFSSHYMTDWWEKYVYLKGRSSIAINSNYYVLDSGRWKPTAIQEARAAVLLHSFMRFKDRLEDDRVKPIMIQDAIPLDMWQYERVFATTRIPGRDIDTIKHWDATQVRHVVVACKGSYYRVNVYRRDGTLRGPDELEDILAAVKRDAASRTPRPAEAQLPALTAENRTRWAEVRETHFSEGVNRRSLQTVESALLFLNLDDGVTDPLDWTGRGKRAIHGSPERCGVWFDKSINLIIFADGKMCVNAEHSWADAPVVAHVMEEASVLSEAGTPGITVSGKPAEVEPRFRRMYDDEGHALPWDGAPGCRSRPASPRNAAGPAAAASAKPSLSGSAAGGSNGSGRAAAAAAISPTSSIGASAVAAAGGDSDAWARIPWALTPDAEEAVLSAAATLRKEAANFELCVVSTSDRSMGGPGYGKDFIKRCSVSPDAFIQAAMQLAYFRDTAATDPEKKGHFDATYESSMTRLFHHGRTETVRPCTQETVTFVRAMQDPNASPRDKLKALQGAAARHVLNSHDAMVGGGIDRHLFALYVVSVGVGKESSFLKSALSVPWKLSTSQQPQQQTPLWDIKDKRWAERISPGGGFGPVATDGYGVSYMVSGEREIFFHISGKKMHDDGTPTRTSVARFQKLLFEALTEMKNILGLAVDERDKEKAAVAAAKASPKPVAAAAAKAEGGTGSTK